MAHLLFFIDITPRSDLDNDDCVRVGVNCEDYSVGSDAKSKKTWIADKWFDVALAYKQVFKGFVKYSLQIGRRFLVVLRGLFCQFSLHLVYPVCVYNSTCAVNRQG